MGTLDLFQPPQEPVSPALADVTLSQLLITQHVEAQMAISLIQSRNFYSVAAVLGTTSFQVVEGVVYVSGVALTDSQLASYYPSLVTISP
jgi:hypothetical protein